MSNPDLSGVLDDLAAGRITAEEARRRIEEASTGRPQFATHATERVGDAAAAEPDLEPEPAPRPRTPRTITPPERGPVGGVERVDVRAVGRRVRLIGDPKVATATVEGEHVLRRRGAVIEIISEGDLGPSLEGFSVLRPPRSLEDVRGIGLGKELVVRLNPKLTADVEVTAGGLRSTGVPYLGRLRVTAGRARLVDVSEVADLLVQAGHGRVEAALVSGRSRVRCESGTLSVRLDEDSNVTVRSEAQLGRVTWAGQHSGAGDEVVMGHGSARLDVDVVMGHATVHVGGDAPDDDPA